MVYRLDSNGNDLGVPWTERNRLAMLAAVEWIHREFPSDPDTVLYGDRMSLPSAVLYFGDWS